MQGLIEMANTVSRKWDDNFPGLLEAVERLAGKHDTLVVNAAHRSFSELTGTGRLKQRGDPGGVFYSATFDGHEILVVDTRQAVGEARFTSKLVYCLDRAWKGSHFTAQTTPVGLILPEAQSLNSKLPEALKMGLAPKFDLYFHKVE